MQSQTKTLNTKKATTPVASTSQASSINEMENDATNNVKNAIIKQKYVDALTQDAGADTVQNVQNGVYNTNLNSLTQSRSNLEDELVNLYTTKYGKSTYNDGWSDFTDADGYSEYVRLLNLINENDSAQESLKEIENSRLAEASTQDSLRQQQQKYLDSYAKMQGMGYGGYSAGIQADTYNNYANAIANINSNANTSSNSIVDAYKSVVNESNNSKNETLLANAQSLQTYANNVSPFFNIDSSGNIVTDDDGNIVYNPNGYSSEELINYYDNNSDTLSEYEKSDPKMKTYIDNSIYTAITNDIYNGVLDLQSIVDSDNERYQNYVKYMATTYGTDWIKTLQKAIGQETYDNSHVVRGLDLVY